MGANASKKQIGEKVKSTKNKLAENDKLEAEQYDRLRKHSPQTLKDMVESIEKALKSYSPFPQTTLLLAFRSDPERVKKALNECTGKVLTAPIQKERYQWFKQYVFASTVWFKRSPSGQYLYRELMEISNLKQEKIIQNMDAVYDHLQSHCKWDQINSIKNQTVISRQDDDAVGLLQKSGIRDISEMKASDDSNDDINALKTFIDCNLAVNTLMTTAKAIDNEFQREMGTILNRHGEFKPGPMKKVERALSKMENDYFDEEYPTAAKVLDIVRCSVSYNTLDQLLDGYKEFMDHIDSGASSMALARVKNGFLDAQDGGYRDIKKKVHKLYSIARESAFFDMVFREEIEAAMKFKPILNVKNDVELPSDEAWFYKTSIDSELGLLGLNGRHQTTGRDKFFCINMETKKAIFSHSAHGGHAHHWMTINDQKYLSLQTTKNTISYFRVSDDHRFEEDDSMKITLDDDDEINYVEYDQSFDHILVVRNKSILEMRSVSDRNTVSISIKLESDIGWSYKNFVNIVSLETQEQFRLEMKQILTSKALCFINGESQLLAVASDGGTGVEIWNMADREMVHHINEWTKNKQRVCCSHSVNGLLALGACSGPGTCYLQIYDVSSWTMMYRIHLVMYPWSIFLTQDSKYLATAGSLGDKCVVLKIQ